MKVFEAIDLMRRMTEEGRSFSFSFMSYSYDRRKSGGIVTIPRARLRRQCTKQQNRFADYMLNYTDLDTMESGQCWQPLLLTLNDIELELN